MGIHVAAADEGPLPNRVAQGCEEIRGGDVGGGEVGCRGSAMGEGAGDAMGIDAGGCWEGGQRRFEGKGVGVEPGQESRFAENACVGELRGVDMGIYRRISDQVKRPA